MSRLSRSPAPRPVIFFLPVLLLGFAGCDSGTGVAEPESMTPFPSAVIDGTVGEPVAVWVTVVDNKGKPYAGGQVTFTVSSGNGSVSPPSANTDQGGQASATWTLGPKAGQQDLTARLGDLATHFTANARADIPASIQALTTYPGTFDPGRQLPLPAVFQVRDQYGNAVPGVAVAFEASHGGGTNPSQDLTNAQGGASTIWTLGPGNGVQTLRASVGSAQPATVAAEAYDPCLHIGSFSIGEVVQGSLTPRSCHEVVASELWFLDSYTFRVIAPTAVEFRVQSVFSGPLFFLYDADFVYGLRSDAGAITFRAFLDATTPGWAAAGTGAEAGKQYLALVASAGGGVGAYSLAAAASAGDMANCQRWISTKTLSTQQTLTPTDCQLRWVGATYYFDWLAVYLQEREGILVTQSSAEIDSWIDIWDGSWGHLAWDDNSGPGSDARLEFWAQRDGFYYITPSSALSEQEGSYTVTINRLGGTAPLPSPLAGPEMEAIRFQAETEVPRPIPDPRAGARKKGGANG